MKNNRTELGEELFYSAKLALEAKDTFNRYAYMIGALMATAKLSDDDRLELSRILSKF